MDFTYVSDMVSGLIRVAESTEILNDVVNLASGSDVSINELARLVLEISGRDGDLEPVYAEPRPHERMVDRDPPSPIVDISKAERLIGYKPRVTVYDGLQKYVEWFRKKRDVSERCKS